jgi:hypothetical protein
MWGDCGWGEEREEVLAFLPTPGRLAARAHRLAVYDDQEREREREVGGESASVPPRSPTHRRFSADFRLYFARPPYCLRQSLLISEGCAETQTAVVAEVANGHDDVQIGTAVGGIVGDIIDGLMIEQTAKI